MVGLRVRPFLPANPFTVRIGVFTRLGGPVCAWESKKLMPRIVKEEHIPAGAPGRENRTE